MKKILLNYRKWISSNMLAWHIWFEIYHMKKFKQTNICFMCSNFTCIIQHYGLREHSDRHLIKTCMSGLFLLNWGSLPGCMLFYLLGSIKHLRYIYVHNLILSYKLQTYPALIIYIFATFEDLDPSKGKKKKMDPTREQAKYIFGDSWGYSFHAEIKTGSAVNFPYS